METSETLAQTKSTFAEKNLHPGGTLCFNNIFASIQGRMDLDIVIVPKSKLLVECWTSYISKDRASKWNKLKSLLYSFHKDDTAHLTTSIFLKSN